MIAFGIDDEGKIGVEIAIRLADGADIVKGIGSGEGAGGCHGCRWLWGNLASW